MKMIQIDMKMIQKHYVEFFSPGTFCSESSTLPIDNWSLEDAAKMAKKITERHGATPYGFRFFTNKEIENLEVNGEPFKVESKRVKVSGMVFITGEVKTYNDIPDTEAFSILKSNMRCNKFRAVIENRNSYLSTMPFGPEDVIIDWDGNVIDSGENYVDAFLPEPS